MNRKLSGIHTASKCHLWAYGPKQKGFESGNLRRNVAFFLAFSSQET